MVATVANGCHVRSCDFSNPSLTFLVNRGDSIKKIIMVLCSVHNCAHNTKTSACHYHRFASDEKTCKEWVHLLGDEDLLSLPVETLHEKRVCSCHFTDNDYVTAKRKKLKGTAVPSIFHEGLVPLSDDKMASFPPQNHIKLHSTAVRVTADHCDLAKSLKARTLLTNTSDTQEMAAIAEGPLLALDQIESIESSGIPFRTPRPNNSESIIPIVQNNSFKTLIHKRKRSSELPSVTSNTKPINEFEAVSYATKKKLLEEAGVPEMPLSPDLKTLLEHFKSEAMAKKELENLLQQKSRECEGLRAQLKTCNCSKKIKMSEGLSMLCAMEERNSNRQAGGERYTKAEITFCANILKRSPECFRILGSLLKLPTQRTLQRSFTNIKLQE